MNKISKTPWKVDLKNGRICDAEGNIVITFYDYDADAEHIVKCVNEHDGLEQERDDYKFWTDRHTELFHEIKQYKEALRKCNAFGTVKFYGYEMTRVCSFCKGETEHANDCEYVRLCGGVE